MPIRGSPNGARHPRPQAGRDRPEWVVAINRNAWSQSIGIAGRDHPVRALRGHAGLPCPVVVACARSLHAFVSFWQAARKCSSTNTRTADDRLPSTRLLAMELRRADVVISHSAAIFRSACQNGSSRLTGLVPCHLHRALAYWGGRRVTNLLVLTVHSPCCSMQATHRPPTLRTNSSFCSGSPNVLAMSSSLWA
jgi:hypothetical protein